MPMFSELVTSMLTFVTNMPWESRAWQLFYCSMKSEVGGTAVLELFTPLVLEFLNVLISNPPLFCNGLGYLFLSQAL